MFARFLAAAVLSAGLASPLAAQYYTVNGVALDMPTQQYLYSIGLPPGNYWLRQDGVWGVVGNPRPLGQIAMPSPNGYTENGTRHYFSGGRVTGGSGQVNRDGTGSYYNPNTGVNFGNLGGGCFMVNGYSNC